VEHGVVLYHLYYQQHDDDPNQDVELYSFIHLHQNEDKDKHFYLHLVCHKFNLHFLLHIDHIQKNINPDVLFLLRDENANIRQHIDRILFTDVCFLFGPVRINHNHFDNYDFCIDPYRCRLCPYYIIFLGDGDGELYSFDFDPNNFLHLVLPQYNDLITSCFFDNDKDPEINAENHFRQDVGMYYNQSRDIHPTSIYLVHGLLSYLVIGHNDEILLSTCHCYHHKINFRNKFNNGIKCRIFFKST